MPSDLECVLGLLHALHVTDALHLCDFTLLVIAFMWLHVHI